MGNLQIVAARGVGLYLHPNLRVLRRPKIPRRLASS